MPLPRADGRRQQGSHLIVPAKLTAVLFACAARYAGRYAARKREGGKALLIFDVLVFCASIQLLPSPSSSSSTAIMHAVRLSFFAAAALRVVAARPVCTSVVRCALPPVARTSSLAPSPSFVPTARRSFAVTANNFERRDNTAELLDFEAGRRDPIKWRKQLMYRSKQRGQI